MGKKFITAVLTCLAMAGVNHASASQPVSKPDAASIINAWLSPGCYTASVDFAVSMPQMNDDVIYSVSLESQAAPSDTLLPVSYIIDWELPARSSGSKGFSAYFNGNHYRYSGGERLQEYHLEWDAVPFMTQGSGRRTSPGVQRSAQFVNLFPAVMAVELKEHADDSEYSIRIIPDTIVGGTHRTAIKTTRTINGVICQEGEYILDSKSLLPVSVVFENNPGTIGEQTVIARYSDSTVSESCQPIDEQNLMARYGDIFARYRESNFRIESMPGHELPTFSMPTLTGERYTHHKGESFRAPVAIVIFDPDGSFVSETIAAVRNAADQLPYSPDLIFAALSSNSDLIEEYLGHLRPGESHLMSAHGLARDCGVTASPVVLIADRHGNVRDVIVGYNGSIRSDLIQKMSGIEP